MRKRRSDLARIRENQRRSRTRRKQHMQEMQQRLSEFELRGVEASSMLQATARRVLVENRQLRALLRLKGVPDTETETFLLSGQPLERTHPGLIPPLDDLTTGSARDQILDETSLAMVSLPARRELMSRLRGAGIKHPHKGSTSARESGSAGLEAAQQFDQTQSSGTQPIDCDKEADENLATPVLHGTPELSPACTDNIDNDTPSFDNTTTCMQAAMIIASMNTDMTVEAASAELGCPPVNDCRVDNFKVFQVMDR